MSACFCICAVSSASSLPFLPSLEKAGEHSGAICGLFGIQLPARLVKFLLAFGFHISSFLYYQKMAHDPLRNSPFVIATWWLPSFLTLHPLTISTNTKSWPQK